MGGRVWLGSAAAAPVGSVNIMERLTRARSKEKGMAPPRVEDYMVSRPRQKRPLKVVSSSPDKENAAFVPNKNRADTLEDINTNDGIVKKFKMSREEKHMNGAPEGSCMMSLY